MELEKIKEAKKGNKEAFEEIIMENIDYFYKIAYAILKNEDDASDAISNTVLKAFTKISQLKNEEFFKTWITKILKNECYDIIRKNQKITYIDEYKNENSKYYQEKEEQLDVKGAIQSLNTELSTIVVLYYIEDESISSISKLLKIPEGTVKSRLSRARSEIAKKINYKEDII